MLYYPEDVLEKLEKLDSVPMDSANYRRFAKKLLSIDPDNGLARILLAATAEEAGDMDEAERQAWAAVERIPNDYQGYFTLSRILAKRDQEFLGRRMFHLAIWKTAFAEEVDPALAALCGSVFGIRKELDDPLTYYPLAVAGDEHIKKEPDPQAVEERILPYRLLNDLQKQARDKVRSSTVKEIIKADAVCAPLLFNSLRQLARDGEELDEPFPLLLTALVGEICGPEMVAGLLELADHEYKSVCLHSSWAIWRLGQRHPKDTLRMLREAAPAASSLLRGRIAEQLTYLPAAEGVTDALILLLDDFGSQEKDEDAETLLALVANGLIERKENDLARKVLKENSRQLSKEGRAWIRDVFEDDGTFETILTGEAVIHQDIHDICVGRVFMDDVDEDLIEEEDDDFFEEPPPPPRPKIGRNEPCWCGSGRKYKKCHLASDEAGTAGPTKVAAPANPDHETAAQLARTIIDSSDLWHTAADLKRAKREYFQNDPATLDPGEENAYLQWFAHDFRDSRTNVSLVEHMWANRQGIPPRTLEILEAWRNSYAGVFEVMRAEKGVGLELRNITSDEIHFVYDVLGSQDAKAGEWLLSRLEWLDGRWQLVSNGFRVQAGLESRFLGYIQTEAATVGETPDEFVRRNGNRLYRVLRRMGTGPVH